MAHYERDLDLIAAAPELLEILKEVRGWHDHKTDERIEALIAKAEGK